MSEVCRDFGISRKTGYKLWSRYQHEGLPALNDRSRRPERLAMLTERKVQDMILALKQKRQTWGAAKILALLRRDHPEMIFPSRTTVHAILDRHGLVKHRGRRLRRRTVGTVRIGDSHTANALWCADYKGQFRLGNRQYCYPLTITDHFSRFLLTCDAHAATKGEQAFPSFRAAFLEYGLPERIRTDNGPPFASSQSLFHLTRLSVWWMRLGIEHERSRPGHPQDNGRHERMHLTLKRDVVPHVAKDLLGQQQALDLWRDDFNEKRPHEALAMKTPAEAYKPSAKVYSDDLPDPVYPDCERTLKVTNCGKVWVRKAERTFSLSKALANQIIGLKEGDDDLWDVRFMGLTLGVYDAHEDVFHRGDL
jgi:transposase InsO family protein